MTARSSNHPYTVYLLHWPNDGLEAHHYVGITTSDRVPERMREHASGRGANLTARLAAEGQPFALAKLWYTSNPDTENKVHQLGACLKLFCPVCQGQRPISMHPPTKRAAGSLPPLSSSKMLLALETMPGRETYHQKKGSDAEAAAPPSLRVP
jgi:predicted GIY-YIG superfamily endonuclease